MNCNCNCFVGASLALSEADKVVSGVSDVGSDKFVICVHAFVPTRIVRRRRRRRNESCLYTTKLAYARARARISVIFKARTRA